MIFQCLSSKLPLLQSKSMDAASSNFTEDEHRKQNKKTRNGREYVGKQALKQAPCFCDVQGWKNC